MRSAMLHRIVASRLRATHPSFALRILASRSATLRSATSRSDFGTSRSATSQLREARLREATSQLRASRSHGIMDIPEIVNCSIKMFADETKLFRTVKSIDDCNILQNYLNIRQVNGLMIGKNNRKLEYTLITETENRILIETREENNLGVGLLITNDLKHEKQVIAASQRAMTVLRTVKKAYVRFDIETFIIIYTHNVY